MTIGSTPTIISYCQKILASVKLSNYNAYSYGTVSFNSGNTPAMTSNGLKNPGTQSSTAYNNTETAVLGITKLPTNWGIYGVTSNVPAVGCSSATTDGYALTDCSGFVNHVTSQLAQSDAPILVGTPNQTGQLYLEAADYANGNFKNSNYWKVTDLAPGTDLSTSISVGQILAWSLPKTGDYNPTGDSGHVMIVAAIPLHNMIVGPDQLPSGYTLGKCYLVKVYDSSVFQHQSDDRPNNAGVGCGELLIAEVIETSSNKLIWCAAVDGSASGLVVNGELNKLTKLAALTFTTDISSVQ